MKLEETSNGVRYDSWLAGSEGAGFIVFKDKHSHEELVKAKAELRRTRDVVTIRNASPEEEVEQFIKDVIHIALEKGLKFIQIRYDAKDLLKAHCLEVTPGEYVKKNFKKWSNNLAFEL